MIKILFYNDDVLFLKTLAEYLSLFGFEVEAAADIGQIAEKIERGSFDLVVGEMIMDGRDGFMFFEKLRRSGNPKMETLGMLLLSADEIEYKEYRDLRGLNIYVMNRYASVDAWAEKINSICLIQQDRVR